MKKKGTSKKLDKLQETAFERQELCAVFQSMDDNNVFFRTLFPEQIKTITELVEGLLKAGSPMDTMEMVRGDALVGKWKLEFSTESRYELLPPVIDIFNYIYDGGGLGKLDTVLRFYKSFVLKSMRAECDYKVDTEGRVVFRFTGLSADLCGFRLPLPVFGDQNGGYIDVQYFDGTLWVESFDEQRPDGSTTKAINVYRKVGGLEEKDRTSIPERKVVKRVATQE